MVVVPKEKMDGAKPSVCRPSSHNTYVTSTYDTHNSGLVGTVDLRYQTA